MRLGRPRRRARPRGHAPAQVRRATGNDYNYYSLAGNSAEIGLGRAEAYAFFVKSFDGELFYKDDDRGSWGLLVVGSEAVAGALSSREKASPVYYPAAESRVDRVC